MHLGNPRHTYLGKNLREASVKIGVHSEHLWETIQLSVQGRESFMTHINKRDIVRFANPFSPDQPIYFFIMVAHPY